MGGLDTPTPGPKDSAAHGVFRGHGRLLCKLLNGRFPRPRAGFSDPASCLRGRGRPWGRRFLVLSACALRHPARKHFDFTSFCWSHFSFYKSSAATAEGCEGGSPSPARAAKGGLTFTGRGRGRGAPPGSQPAPRTGLRPHRRGESCPGHQGPLSPPKPPPPPADPTVPSRPTLGAGPAPPGLGRAPPRRGQRPARAGGPTSARGLGGQRSGT